VAHRSDKALSQESFARNALADLKVCAARGYDALLESSACAWKDVWRDARVEVTSAEPDDQMALDYAVWHLTTMTPAHDERSSIAAKGLTARGIKATSSGIPKYSCCLSICLPVRRLPAACCAIAGLTWLAPGKPVVTAGRRVVPMGSAASGKKRRQSCGHQHPYGMRQKVASAWLNITSWRISPGPLSLTGRRHMMMPLCAMRADAADGNRLVLDGTRNGNQWSSGNP
jgi:hypothetical protein